MSLQQYINQVSSAYYQRDGKKIAALISISGSEVPTRAKFPLHSITHLPDAKWENLIETYLKLVKLIVNTQDINELFQLAIQLTENLNRCAEKQDNWILPLMYQNVQELRRIYRTKLEFLPLDTAGSTTTPLEQMARVVSTSFQLCLNDRNVEKQKSKRLGVYFFIDELFKIYSVLQNFDLLRSTERLFASLRHELPKLNQIKKSHALTYLYFSGAISCAENDMANAHDKLTKALELCSLKKHKSQVGSILVLLIPVQFLLNNKMPSKLIWDNFPQIRALYFELFQAIRQGDLRNFDRQLQLIEPVVLKRQIYVMLLRMRSLVTLRLFEKVWKILDKKPHISVSAFQLALEYSSTHAPVSSGQFKYSLDAAESHIARMISGGGIKGYLSHGNRVVVLSKQDPFPRQRNVLV